MSICARLSRCGWCGGVKNGSSPAWMRRRLAAIGLRPINALVDITNYLTFDRGRPLHVFDAAKVQGELVVRRAEAGESLQALNGKTYALDASMVVIADRNGPESLAGIMGGELSGCDESTTDVLIESALWDPLTIAQTGRKLGLSSDARYRFERGVDPAFCVPGLELATAMVLDFCGGEASAVSVAGTIPRPDLRIDFPLSEVARLTGLDLPASNMQGTLEKLGFDLVGHPDNADWIVARVPSWRPDVHGKADLVEEIVRIAGLDKVEPVPLSREPGVARPVLTLLQRRTRLAKRTLAGCGLLEAVTWSFVSNAQAGAFGGGAPELELSNPIAAELSSMRPSLLPGLIAAAGRNAARGSGDVGLFEVGQIFLGDGEADQRIAAAGLRRGTAGQGGAGRHWQGTAAPVGVFDAKADALTLLASLGVPAGAVQVVAGGPSYLHPGRSLTFRMGPKVIIGSCGEIHPEVLRVMDLTGPVACFEIILDALPPPKARPTKARPKLVLSDFMPLERDYAFLVDRAVPAAELMTAAQSADRALITGVSVFDVYEGQGVPTGQKSVALAITLQPRDRTLAEADLEEVSRKIVEAVSRKTGRDAAGIGLLTAARARLQRHIRVPRQQAGEELPEGPGCVRQGAVQPERQIVTARVPEGRQIRENLSAQQRLGEIRQDLPVLPADQHDAGLPENFRRQFLDLILRELASRLEVKTIGQGPYGFQGTPAGLSVGILNLGMSRINDGGRWIFAAAAASAEQGRPGAGALPPPG